jgi:hypothetical protein
MSIKVGFLSNRYQNLFNDDNFTVNSFINSNAIILNNEQNSTSNVYINFKNKIISGLNSNSYIIEDIQNNHTLLSTNNNQTIINTNVHISSNFNVNNILSIDKNLSKLNNNVLFDFKSSVNNFSITSNNIKLFDIKANSFVEYATNNFKIMNLNQNKTMMEVNNNDTNINNNLYIRNGKLYVDEIFSASGGELRANNLRWTGAFLDDFLINNQLSIMNSATTTNITPLSIRNKYDNHNILNIYTCNYNITPNTIAYSLILNKDGLLGLGTHTPTASLSIQTIASNIINYTGASFGDCINLTKDANLGIGTQIPKSQLHICRNDDKEADNLRNLPMMHLDMNYNAVNNLSNIYSSLKQVNLEEEFGNVRGSNIQLYLNTSIVPVGGVLIQILNTFYMLNSNVLNDINNNIQNIPSQIIINNQKSVSLPVNRNPGNNYILFNNIVYSSSNDYIQLVEDESLRYQITQGNNYFASNVVYMMSKTTYDIANNPNRSQEFIQMLNNPNKFTEIVYKYDNIIINPAITNVTIRLAIGLKIEKNLLNPNNTYSVKYPLQYQVKTQRLNQPPNMMYLTYNNNFISSVSPYGTLSLGTAVPETSNNKYLLYATGTAYINRINVLEVNTENTNSNISFLNNNIIHLNKLTCREVDTSNIVFTNSKGGVITVNNASFSNLITSNIYFEKADNTYLTFSNVNAHFNTYLSIGKFNARELGRNAYLKITTDANLRTETKSIIEKNNGIIVTNENNLSNPNNPCISIKTVNKETIPYLELNNNNSSYYFRVKDEIDSTTSITKFQILSDYITQARDIFFKGPANQLSSASPSFLQHIKEYNLLTFGEQHTICIDTEYKLSEQGNNTNKTPKISIGIPYQQLTQHTVLDYPKYFKDTLNVPTNDYMLNVYGNVRLANINNNPIFTAKSADSANENLEYKISTAINTEPDNDYTLKINGNMYVKDGIKSARLGNGGIDIFEYIAQLESRLTQLKESYEYTSNNIIAPLYSYYLASS